MNNSLNGLRHTMLVQRTLLKLKYLNFHNKMVNATKLHFL